MTKDHPIIFNTAMVQAVLAGRKTQHRIIRRTPKGNLRKCNGIDRGDNLWVRTKNGSPLRRDSRITLMVTDMRLQRLQDITEEDAIAEGVEIGTSVMPYKNAWNAYAAYSYLWDSIYGSDPLKSWDANPEVVALTFDVSVMGA